MGTKLVLRRDLPEAGDGPRRGALDAITAAPGDATSHSYLVRFPDGAVFPLKRSDFSTRVGYQTDGLREAGAAWRRRRWGM